MKNIDPTDAKDLTMFTLTGRGNIDAASGCPLAGGRDSDAVR